MRDDPPFASQQNHEDTGSLMAHVRERLSQAMASSTEAMPEPVPLPQPKAFVDTTSAPAPPKVEGLFLNALDNEMSAGLEQYLQTPVIKYQLAKDRLSQQIQQLQAEVSLYQRGWLSDKAENHKLQALQVRLKFLQKTDASLNERFESIISRSTGPWLARYLIQWFGGSPQPKEHTMRGWILKGVGLFSKRARLLNEYYVVLEDLANTAQYLSQQHDTQAKQSVDDVIHALNKASQTLNTLEMQLKTFTPEESWRIRWSEKMRQWVWNQIGR